MSSSDATIVCPHCSGEIKLSESLAAPFLRDAKAKFGEQLAEKEVEWRNRTEARLLDVKSEATKNARKEIEDELKESRNRLRETQDLLSTSNQKLVEAQRVQAEAIRKERELEERERELELSIEKRTSEKIGEVRAEARKAVESEMNLKVSEKETTIESMKKQIEELRRKAEQGSQQLQGEAQELDLERSLSEAFPSDAIEPVAKGEFGGDALQIVMNASGDVCGTILWESKRTKSWSPGWLPKLRTDQRNAKTDIAAIVSQALPQDVKTFGCVDGVWVSRYDLAVPVAALLRYSIIAAHEAQVSSEGMHTKSELVYQYLSGPRFKQRIEAIIEAFTTMSDDLHREKKSIARAWAKREEQINRVVQSTAGMYGELQGIAGSSLSELKGLDFPQLRDETSRNKN